jgi:hypothetical protein
MVFTTHRQKFDFAGKRFLSRFYCGIDYDVDGLVTDDIVEEYELTLGVKLTNWCLPRAITWLELRSEGVDSFSL